ncbi:MAG: 16S rRNA (cytidine(1402)-2'-O)-methyltransferase [Aliishimia sp.]
MSWPVPDKALPPGVYFVGVPIGTARDITLRALDVLAGADVLAAEDTRSLRRLMEIHGVALAGRRIQTLHDHSGPGMQAKLLEAVAAGKSVAYASEAGMPLIADPGFELSRAAAKVGATVTCAPGPSAVLTALALGGLPTDAFHFAGFLPNSKGARRKALSELAEVQATLVLFESPKRLGASLADAAAMLGDQRQGAVCRELTKKFEEVLRGTLAELAARVAEKPVKGEVVVLIDRAASMPVNEALVDEMLEQALKSMSVKDAAAHVAAATGKKKREIYQRAISFSAEIEQKD